MLISVILQEKEINEKEGARTANGVDRLKVSTGGK